jgi:uncharacterized repeat protein (TIGR01451 family)
VHFGDSPTAPLNGFHPSPSFEEKQALLTALNTTDLAVQQTAPTVEIGQNLAFSIVVENQRPNPAGSIEVTATLPPSAAYVSDTGGCSRASNVLTCPSDQLHPGSTRSLSVTVKTAGTCVSGRPAPLTVTAAVQNTARMAGADPDPADNTRTLTITPTDTGGPLIQNLRVDRPKLWPPNHKLVPVKVSASATDTCGGAITCALSSITSNEPVLAPGTGNTSPDWVITGPNTASLRAERAGGGPGRVYTLTYSCKDASNNTTSAKVTVKVPRN